MNISVNNSGNKLSLEEFIGKLTLGVDADDPKEVQKQEKKLREKLEAGKELTFKEMQFLKRYNKKLYISAVKADIKRESLEKQLSLAKTKKEVEDIQFLAVSGIRKDDPDKKYIIAAINETMKEFKESNYYKSLPEEKEKIYYELELGKKSYQMAYVEE